MEGMAGVDVGAGEVIFLMGAVGAEGRTEGNAEDDEGGEM